MPAKTDKKEFDVSKPGKTPASPTSKPVIVSNRPIMKDPMVQENDQAVPTDESKTSVSSFGKRLQPTDSSLTKNDDQPQTEESAKASDEPKDQLAEETAGETVVDAVLEQAGDSKQASAEERKAQARHDQAQKLIANKTYFLPIGNQAASQKKRGQPLALATLVILILGIATYLLLDAKVIPNDITLPIEFIK